MPAGVEVMSSGASMPGATYMEVLTSAGMVMMDADATQPSAGECVLRAVHVVAVLGTPLGDRWQEVCGRHRHGAEAGDLYELFHRYVILSFGEMYTSISTALAGVVDGLDESELEQLKTSYAALCVTLRDMLKCAEDGSTLEALGL